MSKTILRIEADGNTSNIYINGKKIDYVEEVEFRHTGGEPTELKLKIFKMKEKETVDVEGFVKEIPEKLLEEGCEIY